jgi:hypothetical protein
MNRLIINFYDEEILIPYPKSFQNFKDTISDRFFLDPRDVDELIMYYKDSDDKISIINEMDYQAALFYLSKQLKCDPSTQLTIYLEVSEKSRLYMHEVENSKISTRSLLHNSHINIESSAIRFERMEREKHERIRMEILEKEKMLKELLDRERREIEKREKEREERERREMEERMEMERIEREKLERERMERERIERAEREKIEKEKMERERIERDRIEQERIERERIEAEALKESINKTVIDVVNSNIEKVKDELILRTVLETSKAVEKIIQRDNKLSESKINNELVHKNFSCDGCGTSPIVGIRYHCTVCRDFDFCEDCEQSKADEHPHPMIKFRVPIDLKWTRKRICQRFEKIENNKTNEETNIPNSNNTDISFEEGKTSTFMQVCMDMIGNIKDMFCKREKEEDENNKSEAELDMINKRKFLFKKQLNEIKMNLNLGDLSDDQILTALVKTNGNIDEAIELLFM